MEQTLRTELHDAVATADLHALLCAVAHITGDYDLLRSDLAPDQLQLLVPTRGVSPESAAEGRALAEEALWLHVASGRPVHSPTLDELRRTFAFLVGPSVTPRWEKFLTEELSLPGQDLRAPSWHADALPDTPAPRCAIVGAGASGMVMAHRLVQAGVEVTIFEKNADVGGTWLENVYPGCRVDVPNQLYSFSFAQTDAWKGRFSAQPELLAYLQRVADDFDLRSRISFSSEVAEARFIESNQMWDVEVIGVDGERRTEPFDLLVCAVGQLNRPSFPNIEGRDAFDGPSFHSAQWDHEVNLTGQRVAVIGTGASAAQFVPEIAKVASHLSVFQRTPPWMAPTEGYRDTFPPEYHSLMAILPTYGRWDRVWQFWLMHEGLLPTAKVDPEWGDMSLSVSAANEFIRLMLLEVLRAQVSDDALFEKMTPRFPPLSKRALRDDGSWAAALSRANVAVITEPIEAVVKTGVRTKDGTEHAADVVIYGTGFSASDFVAPMRVTGRGGNELNEQWEGDARAYLGITVPGFPNFFMLYGPNTNLVVNGSILVMVECQVRYIVEAVGELKRRGCRAMEVRRDVHDRYNAEIDEGNTSMAWGVAKVPSWYRNARGRVTQNWPFSLLDYWERTSRPELDEYELT